MTDNARIVREALEEASDYFHDFPESAAGGDDKAVEVARFVRGAFLALTALETKLATTKADLERARVALMKTAFDSPDGFKISHYCRLCGQSSAVETTIKHGPCCEMGSAALAPEQKE